MAIIVIYFIAFVAGLALVAWLTRYLDDHPEPSRRAKNPIGDPFGQTTGNWDGPTRGPHN